MERIKNALLYLCQSTVSYENFLRLVYLLDWLSATANGKPLTDFKWRYTERGPVSDELQIFLLRQNAFLITKSSEALRTILIAPREEGVPALDPMDKRLIDALLQWAGKDSPEELAQRAEATFPLLVSKVGDVMDLSVLAKQAKEPVHA